MRGIYRKEGTALRIENRRGETAIITSRESGRAVSENGQFLAESVPPAHSLAEPDSAEALDMTRRLIGLIRAPLRLEQFQLTQGFASHSLVSDRRNIQWEEKTARVHVTVAHSELLVRCAIDRGGAELAALAPASVARLLEVFQRASHFPVAREGNVVVKLSPAASASLWVALLFGSEPISPPPGVSCVQTLHPDFSHDGFGSTLERIERINDRASWMNFYRPSYRTRPAPMPFHIHVDSSSRGPTSVSDVLVEVLIAPPRIGPEGLRLICLCSAGQDAFIASIRWNAGWFNNIETGEQAEWFPLAAGVWGTEVLLPGGEVRRVKSEE